MGRRVIFVTVFAVTTMVSTAFAEESGVAEGESEEQFKTLSGMSVLGNNEAPKSLVIVPWKSSQIGDGIGLVESLSNLPLPVDRDVFGRELRFYELRTTGGEGGSEDEALRVGRR